MNNFSNTMTVASRQVIFVTLMAFFTFHPACAAQPKSNPFGFERYASTDGLFILFKPGNWSVKQGGDTNSLYIITGSPVGTSFVEFYYAPNTLGNPDAARLMAMFVKTLKPQYPDLSLSETYSSRDRSHVTSVVSYMRNNVRIAGKYFFSSSRTFVSIAGYCAPATDIVRQREMLLNIVSNVSFPAKKAGLTQADASRPAFQPIELPLVSRSAQDGSASFSLPADWRYQALGGKILASSPNGEAGFVFTSLQVMPSNYGVTLPQGVIVSPYRPPSQFIGIVFNQFGNRNVRILQTTQDTQTMQAYQTYLRQQCQAEDLVVKYTSRNGAECLGVFKMANAVPSVMGHWFSTLTGFWAPAAEFPRYAPMLEKIGSSFAINDQYSRSYIQQGIANLRRLQQQTMQSMRDLNQARYDNQAAWEERQERKDFMDSKWDDYRRGNSFWVSELEGGKVYATDPWGTKDTQTGEYYEGGSYKYTHFEGENPNHPSETMQEISSYELNKYLN